MSESSSTPLDFQGFDLLPPILKALDDVGYETPSPIQAQTIPIILSGKDVIGQAQTGTGKTAAFALPLLSRIQLKEKLPQVLVLAPTRELAIQVAEAFQRYAARLKNFHVLPVYGGQDYSLQLRQLKRGVHVVVGTPGRVMDHIRRGSLELEGLDCLVLDEADEMLRMGFLDDVEWILEQTPPERQIALFSATMPQAIRRIAQKHLQSPEEITIEAQTATVETTRQRYLIVSGRHKLDALTRLLESEISDGMIVFVRTKTATIELAEKLQARGYNSAALNGDIKQSQRERTIGRFKKGDLDILVATDVAARGLDVDRVSHVINYDVPYDTESYVHRIGRTGRAGRSGEAVLFIAPREQRLLRSIEKATNQKIEVMQRPSTSAINEMRVANFKQKITDTLANGDLDFFRRLVEQYQQEYDVPMQEIAAGLAQLVQGDQPLLLSNKPEADTSFREESSKKGRAEFKQRDSLYQPDQGMARFRVDVGHKNKVKPGNIVGAVANEIGLDPEFIGRINIYSHFSTVDLPEDLPRNLLHILKKARVVGKPLNIARMDANDKKAQEKKRKKFKKKRKKRKAAAPHS